MRTFCELIFYMISPDSITFATTKNYFMKRIITFLLLMCAYATCFSRTIDMDLQLNYHDIQNGSPRQHKAPARMPSVSYDDYHIYVSAPFEIENASIIIYNEEGEAIFSTITSLTPEQTCIILPLSAREERYSLELAYGDTLWMGYFE